MEFIDTPIKRYSSGMRLRLGFAVAAHLDPDVLVVDEVLAVVEYQQQPPPRDEASQRADGVRPGLLLDASPWPPLPPPALRR
jgi:lipopolysaccharide transport system ATP-binding protein